MKIAVTGHSAGIGQALARIYEKQDHEVIGLSRQRIQYPQFTQSCRHDRTL